MRINQSALILSCILCVGGLRPSATAQANMIVALNQRASSLSGIVFYSGDPKHNGLKDVAVAECAVKFQGCVTVAHSDEAGHFMVHSSRRGKTHYIRLLSPGWDEQQVTVTLRFWSRPLDVELHIGT